MKRLAALVGALTLLLAGCSNDAAGPPATPALWEVTTPDGARGYLFGTIHTHDDEVPWRSEAFETAYAHADTLVVEAAGITDAAASAKIWQELAHTPGLPPLTQRAGPENVAKLQDALRRAGMKESAFADTESWAAALMLARALRTEDGEGIDAALLRAAKGKTVTELEGVAGQLAIFDRLPESDQASLLAAVAEEDPESETRLARWWRTGDIEAIAAETHKGMLADPELREALLVARNKAWESRIEALLREKRTPFVAVGAAHLAGPDGLPALLSAKGFQVRRIQ